MRGESPAPPARRRPRSRTSSSSSDGSTWQLLDPLAGRTCPLTSTSSICRSAARARSHTPCPAAGAQVGQLPSGPALSSRPAARPDPRYWASEILTLGLRRPVFRWTQAVRRTSASWAKPSAWARCTSLPAATIRASPRPGGSSASGVPRRSPLRSARCAGPRGRGRRAAASGCASRAPAPHGARTSGASIGSSSSSAALGAQRLGQLAGPGGRLFCVAVSATVLRHLAGRPPGTTAATFCCCAFPARPQFRRERFRCASPACAPPSREPRLSPAARPRSVPPLRGPRDREGRNARRRAARAAVARSALSRSCPMRSRSYPRTRHRNCGALGGGHLPP